MSVVVVVVVCVLFFGLCRSTNLLCIYDVNILTIVALIFCIGCCQWLLLLLLHFARLNFGVLKFMWVQVCLRPIQSVLCNIWKWTLCDGKWWNKNVYAIKPSPLSCLHTNTFQLHHIIITLKMCALFCSTRLRNASRTFTRAAIDFCAFFSSFLFSFDSLSVRFALLFLLFFLASFILCCLFSFNFFMFLFVVSRITSLTSRFSVTTLKLLLVFLHL